VHACHLTGTHDDDVRAMLALVNMLASYDNRMLAAACALGLEIAAL
jgi:hypothetical protein